jgi:two-component system sensor histidine kinase/response regulator
MPEAILLVDDDPHLMHVLAMFFDLEGYHVLKARDGQQALDLLQEYQPDLVLLDLMMPGVGGLEVCKQIRANVKFQAVPVVIFTAAETREDELRAAGADRFIAKPYSLDGLRETVREMIQGGRK